MTNWINANGKFVVSLERCYQPSKQIFNKEVLEFYLMHIEPESPFHEITGHVEKRLKCLNVKKMRIEQVCLPEGSKGCQECAWLCH